MVLVIGNTQRTLRIMECLFEHIHHTHTHTHTHTLYKRQTGKEAIDSCHTQGMYCIKEYWRDVLKRIVVVIKYLGERGLPFRGDDETFGSAHNGNHIGFW